VGSLRHATYDVRMALPADSLDKVVSLLRDISCCTEPEALVETYAQRRKEMIHVDRTVSLSRRDLHPPFYRITRSDLWKQPVNPWKQKDLLPLYRGGILAELLYEGQPRIIQELRISSDDPAADYFSGMRSLIAIPHFDGGEALNMVVHMRKEVAAFDEGGFPYLVLLSGLFGRAIKGLVMAEERDAARKSLQDQYLAVAQLSDTVLEQAKLLGINVVDGGGDAPEAAAPAAPARPLPYPIAVFDALVASHETAVLRVKTRRDGIEKAFVGLLERLGPAAS